MPPPEQRPHPVHPRLCSHTAAQPLAVDNHGSIYIAAGPAMRGEPAWCAACGSLNLTHWPWQHPRGSR